MMRLITIIILSALMQVSAATFGQKVTLKGNGVTFEKVFWEIRKQTSYDVLISSTKFKTSQTINVEFKDMPLAQAMDKILQGTGLVYTIEDKNVVIKEKEPSFLDRFLGSDDGAFADIRGVLRNERGEALEGITVMVKGAKTGTRTNAKGEFVLKGVKKGDVLVFTGVAIEPFEYTVKDDKNIDLNLKARLVQLEEVSVNTGYQKISKERYVGSYSQLDSAAFHRRAGMGILERLDGTVPGVLFNKKATVDNPDNESPLQIRGLSTLNSDQKPLIVLDNFPYMYDLGTINPNDVENITILKDAAATSIWGARAGNGVIVITTKMGKYNQPIQIGFNSNISISEKPKVYDFPSLSVSDFIEIEKFLFDRDYYASQLNNLDHPPITPVIEILDRIKRGVMDESEGTDQINNLATHDYREDQLKYVYKRQISQQHHLNFSGGNHLLGYRFAVGYNRIGPAMINAKGDDQFTINSSATLKAIKNLDITTGITLSQSVNQTSATPFGTFYPYAKLVDENGNALPVPGIYRIGYVDTVGSGNLLDWQLRPLEEIKNSNSKQINRLVNLNLGANYKITEWLNAQVLGQYTMSNYDRKNIYSLSTYFTRDRVNQFTNLSFTDPENRNPIPVGAIVDYGAGKSISYNLRSQLNLSKAWKNHGLSGLISFDITGSNGSSNTGTIYGYNEYTGTFNTSINHNITYPQYGKDVGASIPSGLGYRDNSIRRLVSLTSNFSYTYKNRYSIYASARRDAANIFGVSTNQKWKPLWSVGTSWDIKRENFSLPQWVDNLTLKASYGYSGNVNNGLSGFTTINYLPTTAFGTGYRYASISDPPNPNLRWEEVRFGNVGLNFSLFSNKIQGSIEVYSKASKDLISPVAISMSNGISSFPINSASLKGHGADLNLSSVLTKGKFSWNPRFGIGFAKMKVSELYSPNPGLLARDFIDFAINPSVGQLAYAISSYKWAGLDPETGDPLGYLRTQISKDYLSIFNDTARNQNVHGSAIPLTSGFLFNNITWDRLSLSFNITFKLNYFYRKPALNYSSLFSSRTGIDDYVRRWQKPGDENFTTVPSMVYPDPTDGIRDYFYTNSEINVLRGDHMKLQDLRVQYVLNNTVLRRIKQASLFCYINNLNLMIWKKDNSPYDPEFVGGRAFIPRPPISFSVGLNLGL